MALSLMVDTGWRPSVGVVCEMIHQGHEGALRKKTLREIVPSSRTSGTKSLGVTSCPWWITLKRVGGDPEPWAHAHGYKLTRLARSLREYKPLAGSDRLKNGETPAISLLSPGEALGTMEWSTILEVAVLPSLSTPSRIAGYRRSPNGVRERDAGRNLRGIPPDLGGRVLGRAIGSRCED